jgi:type II secretory pathway pseudopilin PulG
MKILALVILVSLMLVGFAYAATRQQAESALQAADLAIYTAQQAGKDTTAAAAKYVSATNKLSSDPDGAYADALEAKHLADTAPAAGPAPPSTPPSGGTATPPANNSGSGATPPPDTGSGTNPPPSTGSGNLPPSGSGSAGSDASGAAAPLKPAVTQQPTSNWVWIIAAVVVFGGGFVALVAAAWFVMRKRY